MNGNRSGRATTKPEGCGFLSIEELDRLVEGRIDPDRSAAFDRHVDEGCGACALLAADLEVFVDVARVGVRAAEQEEFDRSAEMLEARLRRKAGRRRIWPGLRPLAAAAVILVAVGLGLFQLRQPSLPGASIDLPRGGAVDVEPMPFSEPPTLRGEPNAAESWQRAGEAYRAGNYARAAELFSEIPDSAPGRGDAALYRGIALLLAGESEAAREALAEARKIAEREDLPSGSIEWFAGLAALADGDSVAATAALERAAASGGRYSGSASELLARLR